MPIDERHVIYVWFDALTNYLTAAGYPDDHARLAEWWPADVHLVGKEIMRFHTHYLADHLNGLGPAPTENGLWPRVAAV